MCDHSTHQIRNPILLFFALAFIGIGSVLLATSVGIGVSTDSIVYIDSARHLADGQGYFTKIYCGVKAPVIKWPPHFRHCFPHSTFSALIPYLGQDGLMLYYSELTFC